jgi:hypothetical protein
MLEILDERQQKQVAFSREYAKNYGHGADGHNNMLIIAKLADELDRVYAVLNLKSTRSISAEEIKEAQGGEEN